MDLRSLFWHHHHSFSIPEANHHSFLSCDFFFFSYQCAKERQLPTSGDRGPSGTDKLQSKISVSTINRQLHPHALVPKASLVYPSLCSSFTVDPFLCLSWLLFPPSDSSETVSNIIFMETHSFCETPLRKLRVGGVWGWWRVWMTQLASGTRHECLLGGGTKWTRVTC